MTAYGLRPWIFRLPRVHRPTSVREIARRVNGHSCTPLVADSAGSHMAAPFRGGRRGMDGSRKAGAGRRKAAPEPLRAATGSTKARPFTSLRDGKGTSRGVYADCVEQELATRSAAGEGSGIGDGGLLWSGQMSQGVPPHVALWIQRGVNGSKLSNARSAPSLTRRRVTGTIRRRSTTESTGPSAPRRSTTPVPARNSTST